MEQNVKQLKGVVTCSSSEFMSGKRIMRADLLAGLVGSCQITLRQVQIDTMGFFDLLLFQLSFVFIFGSGVLEPLNYPVVLFEETLVVVVVPPTR